MTFAEWEAQRKASEGRAPSGVAAPPPQDDSESGILPSNLSALGSLAGLAGKEYTIPGAAIGSEVNEIRKAAPGLWENGIGPLGSEGVGDAMLKSLLNVGSDTAKAALLDRIPGMIGKVADWGGNALTKFGASATANLPLWQRAFGGTVADTALHQLGVPPGVTTAGAVLAPPLARTMGPALTRVGEAMPSAALEGIGNVVSRRSGEIKAGWGAADEAADTGPFGRGADPSMRANVEAAQHNQNAGMSRKQANQRAGYGVKSAEIPYNRTDVIDQPDLSDFKGPKAIAAQLADLSATRKSLGANPLAMREDIFNRAMTKLSKGELGRSPTPDIQDTLNELARKRYVSK